MRAGFVPTDVPNKKDTHKECFEGGVFTKGEDTHTLRLTSKLVDLRVEYANPATSSHGENPLPLRQKKKHSHTVWCCCVFWRRGRDSNPRVLLAQTDFESVRLLGS